MDKDDLTATGWFTSRFVVFLLVLGGVFFWLRADWLGYSWLKGVLGSETNLLATGLGVAFFVLAAQSWEKAQIRVETAEMTEALHQLLYGKDYRRDREAIEILLTALEAGDPANARAAHAHLMRLTGQNFAQDPKVWRPWWEANKKQFARSESTTNSTPRQRPDGVPPSA